MADIVAQSRPIGVGARVRRAGRAVPAPLAALLGAVLLLGVTWALVVPPFQAPDEQSHFGYVQSLVDGPGLPGDQNRPGFSTELTRARDAVNSDQTAAQPQVKPTWSAFEWERWQAQDERLPAGDRGDGGGIGNPAWSNPPLYYLYAAVPYTIASGDDLFARLTLVRLASVLWLLVTVVGTWLLAGEVLGRDRVLQLVAAAVAGLLPMVVFISAQVGPDGMLYALWTLALWLGVRILRRGIALAPAVALLGVTGVAILVKATSYALVPPVLLALAVGLWRIRGETPRALRIGCAALAAFVLPLFVWALTARLLHHAVAAQVAAGSSAHGTNWRELASYVWQYYLPRLPFMSTVNFSGGGYPAYHIWIEQWWGAFGWLEVRFPKAVYKPLAAITALVAVAALARVGAAWRHVDRAVALFLLLVAATLLAALHWTDYHNHTSGAGNFIQGRYLFPLVGLGGVAVALALTWLRASARQLAAGALVGGLVVLQMFSLALVTTRFYA